jgi:hypothetical protein
MLPTDLKLAIKKDYKNGLKQKKEAKYGQKFQQTLIKHFQQKRILGLFIGLCAMKFFEIKKFDACGRRKRRMK